MAMSAVYTTVGGMLVEEVRGGTVTEYVPDPLGSLAQARNSAGSVVYSAEYWPYGEVRTETGTNPSPWGFVGLLGYFRDALNRLYVRVRTYRPDLARWTSVDPLWPRQPAYTYVADNPTTYVDPSGLTPACVACGICLGIGAVGALLACSGSPDFSQCVSCWCRQNPIICGILIGVCAVTCTACIPGIIGLLPKIPPPLVPAMAFTDGSSYPKRVPCGPGAFYRCMASCIAQRKRFVSCWSTFTACSTSTEECECADGCLEVPF